MGGLFLEQLFDGWPIFGTAVRWVAYFWDSCWMGGLVSLASQSVTSSSSSFASLASCTHICVCAHPQSHARTHTRLPTLLARTQHSPCTQRTHVCVHLHTCVRARAHMHERTHMVLEGSRTLVTVSRRCARCSPLFSIIAPSLTHPPTHAHTHTWVQRMPRMCTHPSTHAPTHPRTHACKVIEERILSKAGLLERDNFREYGCTHTRTHARTHASMHAHRYRLMDSVVQNVLARHRPQALARTRLHIRAIAHTHGHSLAGGVHGCGHLCAVPVYTPVHSL